jgi:4-amino-4-deoxy-L-arabinose transferase-like glycosyltransferase
MVLGLVLLLPTLSYRMSVDHGTFAHIGSEILKGRWPYIDTWESDWPGMMFLQAAEILAFGRSIAMFRVFDLLVQLVSVYLIYRLAVRVGSRAGGLLAVGVYCLVYQGYGPWNTAQREGFAVPFILWGFWLFFTAERRPAARTALGIGLGLGLATTFKPTLLALAAFYLPLFPGLNRSNWKIAGWAVAGVLVPAAVFTVFYAWLGGLRQLFEATVSYQAVYTARLRGDRPLVEHWLGSLLKLGRQASGLAVGYLPFLLPVGQRRDKTMLYLGFLGSVLGVIVQGTFAGYHYLPGLAVGSILIGSAFAPVFGWLQRRWPRLRTERHDLGFAAVIVVAALPFYLHAGTLRDLVSLRFLEPPVPGEFRNGTVFDFTESYDVAGYLREHTTPADPILVWGYDPLVYYLADRRAASRFGISHPLVMRVPGQAMTPMQLRWRSEFVRDVDERKPRYVAVIQHDNWWWAPEERTSEELLDDFPEWKALLRRRYQLEQTIGRFLVYRRTQ